MSDLTDKLRARLAFDEMLAQKIRFDVVELNVDHPISATCMKEYHARLTPLLNALIQAVSALDTHYEDCRRRLDGCAMCDAISAIRAEVSK